MLQKCLRSLTHGSRKRKQQKGLLCDLIDEGVRFNADGYIRALKTAVMPCMNDAAGEKDSSPAYKAEKVSQQPAVPPVSRFVATAWRKLQSLSLLRVVNAKLHNTKYSRKQQLTTTKKN